MRKARKRIGVFFRDVHGSVGFVLPDEAETLKAFFSIAKVFDANTLHGKRCWLYARTANDSGNPMVLEGQLRLLRLSANKCRMMIVGETYEVASGLTLNRIGWNKVMAAATSGAFDVLLVKDMDRMARDCFIAYECLQALDTYGITPVFADNLR